MRGKAWQESIWQRFRLHILCTLEWRNPKIYRHLRDFGPILYWLHGGQEKGGNPVPEDALIAAPEAENSGKVVY